MTKTLNEIQINAVHAHLNAALIMTIDSRIEQDGEYDGPTWYEMIVEPSEDGEVEVFQALAEEREKTMTFIMGEDFLETCQAAVETFVDDVVARDFDFLLDPDHCVNVEEILDPTDHLQAELLELATILVDQHNG